MPTTEPDEGRDLEGDTGASWHHALHSRRVSRQSLSEALFRTCKYRPEWPTKGFSAIEAARDWVKHFADWYNGEHLHSAIRFVTPNMRHARQEQTVLAARPVSGQGARGQAKTMVRTDAQLGASR